MAKTKTNSGSEFQAGEIGSEAALPAQPYTHVNVNSAHSFTEGAEVTDYETTKQRRRPKGKYLAAGGDIHEFKQKGDYFVGKYTGRTLVREKDAEKGEGKAGDVMGYYFEDNEGVPTVIGNSYQIEKSINQVSAGAVLYIEFLGQKDLGGKRMNQFDVIELDTPEERAYYGF